MKRCWQRLVLYLVEGIGFVPSTVIENRQPPKRVVDTDEIDEVNALESRMKEFIEGMKEFPQP